MCLTYKYRLRPTSSTEAELLQGLQELRFLYNYALEERRNAGEKERRSVSYLDQQSSLPRWRAFDAAGLGRIPYDPARDVLQRLDLAFRASSRRRRDGKRPGSPRFRRDVRSFTFGQPDATRAGTRTIRFPVLGAIEYVRHRDPPSNGVRKKATVIRDVRAWYVALSYQVPDPPPPRHAPPEASVWVDLGLTDLATLSDGEVVDPPMYLRKAAARRALEQRRLARKQRGSRRRERPRLRVAECRAKIRRSRRDFAHKLTSRWAARHDLIAFEDLDVTGMARGPFARSLADAGWGILREMCRYKMALRPAWYIEVDSAGTTQPCSECGRRADPPLGLGDREFRCPVGHRMDRDWNAARNVLARGCIEVGRKPTELTHGERVRPPKEVGQTVYQRRRVSSGSRESSLTRGGEPAVTGGNLPMADHRPER